MEINEVNLKIKVEERMISLQCCFPGAAETSTDEKSSLVLFNRFLSAGRTLHTCAPVRSGEKSLGRYV